MITPNDIKEQLMSVLPQYTDEYGDKITGSAETAGGVLVVTAAAHGLTSGEVISVSEAKINITVSGVSYDSVRKIATITLAEDHDRTSGVLDNGGFNVAVLQDFADSNYNGDFNIRTATDNTMDISMDADVVGDLGSFAETRGLYLGLSEVTKIDANTFSIPIVDGLPNSVSFDSFKFVVEQRIFIAADVTRAVTKWAQPADRKPTLFIIFGQENASKDRNTISDAVMAVTSQNLAKLKYVAEFALLTCAVSKTDQLAAAQVQKVYAEIRPALRRALWGNVFDTDDVLLQYAVIEVGNSTEIWNQNNYLHRFDYQAPYDITLKQGAVNRRSVSFRNIVLNSKMFNNENDDVIEVIVNADLEV